MMLKRSDVWDLEDGIAVVGIGCALPGGNNSPEELWTFLREGGDGICDVPPDRWTVDAVYDPHPSTPGKTVARRAAFLKDVVNFDAGFFGVSPREAQVMDPQHRLLLEVTWRALENAGIPAESLAGSETGVYIGISHSDYHAIQQFGRRQIDVHTSTGGALSIAANRISHRFDLKGPSICFDTACSSSLVALDAACDALRRGHCELAIVGGVNLMLTPDVSIAFSRANMLSPNSTCKPFDASADGYVRGEGCGVVILAPFHRAREAGSRLHAVVRATAVNQDGRTSTITVPSRDAQAKMLRQVCARAGIDPSQVDYVEAHGTGTPVGDPIEAGAIGQVFGEGREPGSPCLIGSIKSNIGHLEPAAGIAGFIKAVLCVANDEIPPNLHFRKPNPNIDFNALGLQVVAGETGWPNPGKPRMAVVNSFGFGGTNACALIQQLPPSKERVRSSRRSSRPALAPLSAATPSALKAVATQVADAMEQAPDSFDAILSTLALHRSHLQHRIAVSGSGQAEVVAALRAHAAGASSPAVILGRHLEKPKLAFVFSGQGAQWWGMGRWLMNHDPVFRETLGECDELFRSRSGWSLIDRMSAEESRSRMNETFVAQPATFALQVGVSRWLQRRGVQPAAVAGHSIGEIAAAHVSGALSLPDAIDVVYHRSRLQENARLQGSMVAIGLAPEEASNYLRRYGGSLEIAAINGPSLVTLAGPRTAVAEFVSEFERDQKDVLCQPLRVDYAFHSAQMDPFMDQLRASLSHISPVAPDLPMISTVTGRSIESEPLDGDYWARNMRDPVQFKAATETLIGADFNVFLEVGPHPSLVTPIRASLAEKGRDGVAIGTLHRTGSDDSSLAASLGALHVHGVRIDWTALVDSAAPLVPLPGYPWERKAYWSESEESRSARFDAPVHPLLGYRMRSGDWIWQNEIDAATPRYLADHVVDGTVLFPAAGYIEMMIAAARQVHGEVPIEFEDLTIDDALFLGNDVATLIETRVDAERGLVEVRSRHRGEGTSWVRRAKARVLGWQGHALPIEQWQPKIDPPTHAGRLRIYRDLKSEGHLFGPHFQAIETIWFDEGYALGRIAPAPSSEPATYLIHPTRLDACFQVIRGFRGFGSNVRGAGELVLPVGIQQFRFYSQPSGALYARARVQRHSPAEIVAHISVFDEAGRIVASIDGFRCLRVEKPAGPSQAVNVFLRESLVAAPQPDERKIPKDPDQESWLILSGETSVGPSIADAVQARGGSATLVLAGSAFEALDRGRYRTTPDAKGLARLIAEMPRKPTHVLHLWSLAPEDGRPSAARLVSARRLGIEALAGLTRALAQAKLSPQLWVAAGGAIDPVRPESAEAIFKGGLVGFLRSLANEHPEWRPRIVDLQVGSDCAAALVSEIDSDPPETEIVLRQGERLATRLDPVGTDDLRPRRLRRRELEDRSAFQVTMRMPGSMDNLRLAEMARPSPGPNELLIEVRAAGLNFRDVMAASGLLPPAAEDLPAWQNLGLECSGVVIAVGEGVDPGWIGRRVATVRSGALASHVTAPLESVFALPRGLSFAQAAAVPVAYATAYHSLVTVGRLARGESVLIHAATGGVGLAAIAVARHCGARVIATAGSPEKRAYLHGLGVEDVFDSRSPSFADAVLWKTDDRGVDVVLNSLPGELLKKSLSILAPGGRFLEIGKRDIYADAPIGLKAVRQNVSFCAIDLAKHAQLRPAELRREIDTVLKALSRKDLAPLPLNEFPVSQVADAFRHMAKARHIGKIVIGFEDPHAPVEMRPAERPAILPDATYAVTGGTGGLGLETARWLVFQGARSLVLNARSADSPAAAAAVADLRGLGADVEVVAADVSQRAGARKVVDAARRSGRPLRGIFHAAGVIEDAAADRLRTDQIRRVYAGKVLGAWHLHELTRTVPLDHFVMFSSVAATLGSVGQAHYSAANRTLDEIARHRQRLGLPALAVGFGPVEDAGFLTRDQKLARHMKGAGLRPMRAAEAMESLGLLMRHAEPGVASASIDWSRLQGVLATLASSPRTAHFAQGAGSVGGVADSQLKTRILAAPEDQRGEIITDYLRRKVASVLKVQPRSIELNRPLADIGLDSLTAFELKNKIERELGIALPIGRFLQRPSIAAIVPAVLETISQAQSGSSAGHGSAEDLAMSIGQEALWFVDRLDPGNHAYSLTAALAVRPHFDADYINAVIQRLIARHDNLRMIFPSDGIGPVPTLLPAEQAKLTWHDAAGWSDERLQAAIDDEIRRPFLLDEGPLGRLHIFRRADSDVFVLQFHHIVADAASVAILMHEMFEDYALSKAGGPLPAPVQRASYSQFAAWQREIVGSEQGERHRAYWRQELADAPAVLNLPVDRDAERRAMGEGASRAFHIHANILEEIKGLANAEGVTLFSVLLAAFNVMLARLTGERDLVVGIPASGRTRPEFENVVGYLVNALPIRTVVSDNATFGEILQAVEAKTRAGLEHQDYPFASVVRDIVPPRIPGRFPIFQVMFGMERFGASDLRGYSSALLNVPGSTFKFQNFTIDSVRLSRNKAPFDLTVTVEEAQGQLLGVIDYRSDLWSEATIERLVDSYSDILRRIVGEPSRKVVDFRPNSVPPRISGPPLRPPMDLVARVLGHTAERPRAVAISDAAGDLAYADLSLEVRRLARGLAARGIGPGSVVAFCLPRGRDIPIAMLAILMAGAAYLPLDPAYPERRLAEILADAGPAMVLTGAAEIGRFPGQASIAIEEAAADTPLDSPVTASADTLAYVIHTSGSSGRPSGVDVTRGNLEHFMSAMQAELSLAPEDVWLAVTTPAFDIAVLELMLPLAAGARLVVADDATARDGARLARRLDAGDVTIMQGTPATWQMAIDGGWNGRGRLRALCGGEALDRTLARAIAQRAASLVNLYGPTETTVWSLIERVEDADGPVPIGRPIPGTDCLVVDDALVPVEPGIAGELLIGGAGVARGYRNDLAKTAGRFVADPRDPSSGRKMYRSGDLVRMSPDGRLMFLGRRDNQIKLRGHRIELEEIEARLRAQDGVADAAVVVLGDSVADRRMTALVVRASGTAPACDTLAATLRTELPSFMVPAAIHAVDRLPRLANGKIDRAGLHPIAERLTPNSAPQAERPPSDAEAQLLRILKDILQRDDVGLDQDFFAIGGTSLRGIRYIIRINDMHGISLGAADLMRAPTAAAMAARIAEALRERRESIPSDAAGADVADGRSLWRPLPMLRVQGAFDDVDAAAIVYLPDDLLLAARRYGVEGSLRSRLAAHGRPSWNALCSTALGTVAIVGIPSFGADLISDPAAARDSVDAAIAFAGAIGAPAVSLTGMIPAVTGLGAGLTARDGITLTTGHATTASAVLMSAMAAVHAAGRSMSGELVGFAGLGSIGQATLRLLLRRGIRPRGIVLCDLPARLDELRALTGEIRDRFGYGGPVDIVAGTESPALYSASLIVGATNVPGVVDIARLAPGTIMVDDSFPYCFDAGLAQRRIEKSGDILVTEGGSLTPSAPVDWTCAIPPGVISLLPYPLLNHLLPRKTDITGCILSGLLGRRFGAPPTIGPVDDADSEQHFVLLQENGFAAGPLQFAGHRWTETQLAAFAARFGAA